MCCCVFLRSGIKENKMDFIFTLISFAAVVFVALFISIKCKISTALTPFVSTCFSMMLLSAFGCFGLVKLGGYIYFALALAAAVAVIFAVKKDTDCLAQLATPGFAFFTCASLFVIVLFAIKQPMFISWDEFSFWGTSIKLVKISDEMYTTAQIGWSWAATQKPGLIMNAYLYEFFGSYQEWRACAGTDVLMFSAVSALTAYFTGKNWHKAVPFMVVGFLTPFAFSLYGTIYAPSNVYMTVMADLPMGMIFGGVLCLYFSLKDKAKGIWAVCLALATLTFIKDTAFAIAMVAAVIICADIVLVQKECDFFGIKRFLGKIINCAFVFVTPVVLFLLWTVYLGVVLSVDATGNVGGSEEMSMVGMMVEGVKQLLGIGVTEKFSDVMGRMYQSYFGMSLTVLGTGFRLTIICLVLCLIALLTAAETRQKISCALFAFLSTAGFVIYYIFIGFCFVFVFKEAEASTLMSYERYVYPYYIGWFLTSVMLVAQSVAQKKQKLFGLGRAAVFAIILLMVVRLSSILIVGYTFVDYDRNFMNDRYEQQRKSADIVEYIGETDQKIFFIGQGDDGNKWFRYSSQLLPLQLAYSYGGGTICLPDAEILDDSPYYIKITPKELLEYIKDNDCGYVFVETNDEFLTEGFGHLFSDNLSNCGYGISCLYRVNGNTFEFMGEVN